MDTPSELKEVVLPQTVVGPLTRAAIFLVVCIRQDGDAYARLCAFCADLSGLIRAVDFRDVEAGLTCVAGFGSDAWDNLFERLVPPSFIRFRRFAPGDAMPSPRRATFSSTFEPNAWTYASNSLRTSWRASGTWSPSSTRCTAFAISTTAM
jgi:hypothetical protein